MKKLSNGYLETKKKFLRYFRRSDDTMVDEVEFILK